MRWVIAATGFAWFKYYTLVKQTPAEAEAADNDADVDFDDKQSLAKYMLVSTVDYYASMQKTWLILGTVWEWVRYSTAGRISYCLVQFQSSEVRSLTHSFTCLQASRSAPSSSSCCCS